MNHASPAIIDNATSRNHGGHVIRASSRVRNAHPTRLKRCERTLPAHFLIGSMMRYHRNTLRSRIGDGEALDAGDNEVYDTEHIPHLAKVPGVVSAPRFKIEYSVARRAPG
jgi:hypothetical protein